MVELVAMAMAIAMDVSTLQLIFLLLQQLILQLHQDLNLQLVQLLQILLLQQQIQCYVNDNVCIVTRVGM